MIRTPALLINVLIVAVCGLVYELLAATLASYVLGDSVKQFSLIIGLYLSAMGVGAWLSGYIDKHVARAFIEVEVAVALLGGISAPLLFRAFSTHFWFQPILYGLVIAIGVLVGLELPLLMRILRDHLNFKDLVSRALAIDYIGALLASLLFPLLLMPHLGLIRTSLLFGMLNAGVALWGTQMLEPLLMRGIVGMRGRAGFVMLLLAVGLIKADYLTLLAEDELFADPIVYAQSSPYQRIVVTANPAGFQLYLNGNLQFSSADEYRYHEALVHPALSGAGKPRRVLVLGGGDGLALREILKYPSVEHVTLVDLDPAMTSLPQKFPPLSKLNGGSLLDPRVEVINQDAMIWLEEEVAPFDVAIIDFPDPNNYALGKLYTTRFYRMLAKRLTPDAIAAVQCASPFYNRKAFWCIIRTLEAAGFQVRPYQMALPSFGVWGFALAGRQPVALPARLPENLKYLDDAALRAMFVFSVDMGPVPVDINRLDNQSLVHYYEAEWKHWD
jgi:spermidine synthase